MKFLTAALAVSVLVLSACSGATQAAEPEAQAPTTAPVTAAPSTEAPTEAPTDDADAARDLAAAREALEEFRAAGELVAMAGNALDGDYSEFETAASALLDQMNKFTDASQGIRAEGPYAAWYAEALRMAIQIATAVENWDVGLAEDDVDALMAGNEAMDEATDLLPAFNAAAAEWEGDCP